jgi:hypothetical protein
LHPRLRRSGSRARLSGSVKSDGRHDPERSSYGDGRDALVERDLLSEP